MAGIAVHKFSICFVRTDQWASGQQCMQWRIQGGPNRPRPPPPLFRSFFYFYFFIIIIYFFFVFACHPGGRSGRRTVPLPNNVNDATTKQKITGKKMCRSLARHRISGPPFSQILDPPLVWKAEKPLSLPEMSREGREN